MKKMQMILLGSAALVSFVMIGCGPTAHVQKDETVNFSDNQTYAWSEAGDLKDAAKNSSSFTEQHIKTVVDKELEKQG
ncbi:MAG TPA: hypothetical protein PLY34_05165 [Ferruginibacter sp.]|jgi:hypothetical protein|nr:hypothetical protein [Ferruginibacter sp.]HPH91207.1 hypothetical protein [Ferruginibacter sp.]